MPNRSRICVLTLAWLMASVAVPMSAGSDAFAQATTTRVRSSPNVASRAARVSARRVSPPAAPAIRAVPLLSHYETATRVLSRDIGVSVVLPDGHELWLFGDTSVYTRGASGNWANTGFVDGSTALEGKYVRGQVPHGGEYPTGSPSRFIPVPKNVYLPDGTKRSCVKSTGDAAFAARWPTGAVVLASNTAEVLVTYVEVCVTVPSGPGGPLVRAEGWGYMLYNWRVRHIAVGPVDVFRPHAIGDQLDSSHIFGWPVYVNGKLMLFSSSCSAQYLTCGGGHVWSVTTSKLSDPGSYHPKPMLTDGSAPWEPLSISVGMYTTGLRLIEITTIGGDYRIFATPKLGAPWHVTASGTLPDCVPNTGYCHGVEGHPELSTPTSMFISYKDPNSGPGGHMVISAVPG